MLSTFCMNPCSYADDGTTLKKPSPTTPSNIGTQQLSATPLSSISSFPIPSYSSAFQPILYNNFTMPFIMLPTVSVPILINPSQPASTITDSLAQNIGGNLYINPLPVVPDETTESRTSLLTGSPQTEENEFNNSPLNLNSPQKRKAEIAPNTNVSPKPLSKKGQILNTPENQNRNILITNEEPNRIQNNSILYTTPPIIAINSELESGNISNTVQNTRDIIKEIFPDEFNGIADDQQFFKTFFEDVLGFKKCDDLIRNIKGKLLTAEKEKQHLFAYVCYMIHGFNFEIIDLFYRISSNLKLHYFDRFNAATDKYSYLKNLSQKYKKDSYNQVINMIDELFASNPIVSNKDRLSKLIRIYQQHLSVQIRTAIEEVCNEGNHDETINNQQFFKAFFETDLGFNKLSSPECDDLIRNIEKPKGGKQLTAEEEKQDAVAYVCYAIYGFNSEIFRLLSQIDNYFEFHYFDRVYKQESKARHLSPLRTKYNSNPKYAQLQNMIDERFVINDLILKVKEKLENKDALSNTTNLSNSSSNETVEEPVSPIVSTQAEEDRPENIPEVTFPKKRKLNNTSQQRSSKKSKKDTSSSKNIFTNKLSNDLQTFFQNYPLVPHSLLNKTTLTPAEGTLLNTILEKFKENPIFNLKEKLEGISGPEKCQFFTDFFYHLFAYEELSEFNDLKTKIEENPIFSEFLKSTDEKTLRMYICYHVYELSYRSIAFLSRLCQLLKLDYLTKQCYITVKKSLIKLESKDETLAFKQRNAFIDLFNTTFASADSTGTTTNMFCSRSPLNAALSQLDDTTTESFKDLFKKPRRLKHNQVS